MGLRGQILGLRGQISGLRGPGGDERTDKRMNERTKVPCVLQDFIPFGAAAQKMKGRTRVKGEGEAWKLVVAVD